MPFDRPTLVELRGRTIADVEARLLPVYPDVDVRSPISNLNVLATVLAGLAHGLYGYLAWSAEQANPMTATGEWLELWAGFWGVYRTPATAAEAVLQVTGAAASVIPAGTRWQRRDGIVYRNEVEAVISGAGTVLVEVVAELPGSAGSLASGQPVSLINPVPGVATAAVVQSDGLVSGNDVEADASLRSRLLARLADVPHGGSRADYVRWARELPGVTRVWVQCRGAVCAR
jgi:uncharacterized phage protein gp47/JayE